MPRQESGRSAALGLRAGDLVEVRSAKEILATLDAEGSLDALPFMPEMLQYCGRRFRVYKRADKTCDTIERYVSRRMENTVHLEGLRCDGSGHGGCQASCSLFWKEAWLKRVKKGADAEPPRPQPDRDGEAKTAAHTLAPTTQQDVAGTTVYSCQTTQLLRASRSLPWWDFRQYVREVWTGNVSLAQCVRALAIAAFNVVQRRRGGLEYLHVRGECESKTPSASLNLQPGELVRIKSAKEIFATLNDRHQNRGLWFDVEMLPFCGTTARVRTRVARLIDEKTGKMVEIPSDCIILEGVTCGGCLSRERLLCPRSIYPYWREIWLERVAAPVTQADRTLVQIGS